jgi:hypothetical protein
MYMGDCLEGSGSGRREKGKYTEEQRGWKYTTYIHKKTA